MVGSFIKLYDLLKLSPGDISDDSARCKGILAHHGCPTFQILKSVLEITEGEEPE